MFRHQVILVFLTDKSSQPIGKLWVHHHKTSSFLYPLPEPWDCRYYKLWLHFWEKPREDLGIQNNAFSHVLRLSAWWRKKLRQSWLSPWTGLKNHGQTMEDKELWPPSTNDWQESRDVIGFCSVATNSYAALMQVSVCLEISHLGHSLWPQWPGCTF